eukprot:TRINITY_DN9192_c0_g2_i2.p1 TRINITY_DN9192_c0_g2~~TRINITY_DN9192_c0_g2_i2.p1  ORF type:complete len:289 (+),score=33.23 TRINITY_DN9192_c0_g2_i2:138-1004(+)
MNLYSDSSIANGDTKINKLMLMSELEKISMISRRSEFPSGISPMNLLEVSCKDGASMQGKSKVGEVFGITPIGFDKQFKEFIASNSNPNLTVVLPKMSFEVDELTLTSDLSFVGSPGTQLTVTKGPIAIKAGTVMFKECVILLDGNEEAQENTPRRLFEVWNNAQLHLVDCLLKIDSKIETRSEICVYIHSQSYGEVGGLLRATSCSMINFFSQIIAGNNSQVHIDNCGFSRSSNSSILAINPLSLFVKNSNFDDVDASGVEVRLTQCNSKVKVAVILGVIDRRRRCT